MSRSGAKRTANVEQRAPGVEEQAAPFVLGRAAMAKLLEVEGLRLTSAAERILRDFDRRGMSDDERQDELLRRYRKAGS